MCNSKETWFIKDHPWFKSMDWDKLKAGELTPPIIPKLGAEDDLKYFDDEFLNMPTRNTEKSNQNQRQVDETNFEAFNFSNLE